MSRTVVQVVIRGRVQGVGYRAWVEYQAQTIGLEGWVRNRRDGSVEAVFAGPTDVVGNMVALCWQGPSTARVDNVADEPAGTEHLSLRRAGELFSVLPTL